MEFGNHTAEVLVEALPYIKKFYGTTIVIKYGGHAMVDKEMREKVISDIVLMRFVGMNPILVHGGGPDINYQLEKENYQSKFVDGLRVTDSEVLDIAQMVLVGKVNQEIVALLQKHGGNAVGLSGIDGGTIQAKKKLHYDKEHHPVDLGYVGEITDIRPALIRNALEKEYIPVISPIGLDEQGGRYNINGDTAAAAIAAALKADKFFLLTDTDGILDNGRPSHQPGDDRRPRRFESRWHDLRRHDPESGLLPARHPKRRGQRAHHQRPDAAQLTLRIIHRRWCWHHGRRRQTR